LNTSCSSMTQHSGTWLTCLGGVHLAHTYTGLRTRAIFRFAPLDIRYVPISEADLDPACCKMEKAWFVDKSFVDGIRDNLESTRVAPSDYKKIVIDSPSLDCDPYVFFDRVTGLDGKMWDGYLALGSTQWSDFCYDNELLVGDFHTIPSSPIDKYSIDNINHYYDPNVIDGYFSTDVVQVPSIYLENPFRFINDSDACSDPGADEQTNGAEASEEEINDAGSNPLGEITGSQNSEPGEASPRKRKERDYDDDLSQASPIITKPLT
jgi:hypothetical protein